MEKTYTGWIQENRAVKPGEQAKFFLVDPETKHSWGLFTEDQTRELTGPPSTCVRIARDERPAAQKNRPKVKLYFDFENGRIAVWVGPNKKQIEWLKDKSFKFDPHSYTWKRTLKNVTPENLIKHFEEAGCVVEHDLVEAVA